MSDTFTGVVRTYYDTEKTKLQEEYFIHNGKKEGIYKVYDYSTGLVIIENNYINGKKEGISQEFYNGNIFIETNYKNDKKYGTGTIYYENGNIRETIEYENEHGLKHGENKEYDENGNLIKETTWLLDKRHSECKIYVDNKLSEIYTYVSGTYDGPYKKFHSNGKIAIEGMYLHHRRNGIFKYYNENGDLILQEEYDFLTGKKK
jgi:antitoxin component YwqK of YwqJK toxin-antitoxin module